ncbi:MAG: VOC family protein [Blastocatellia bacterium]|nr:VOC family protein [Blastocatellia bacterium]
MSKVPPCPEGMRWVIPYLAVKNPEAAIDFYTKAFGFEIRDVVPGSDGKPMHVELNHKDSVIMFAGEDRSQDFTSPLTIGGTGLVIYAYTEDVDALFERAKAAGAKAIDEPKDQFWGDRCCLLADPDNHKWMFATHLGTPTQTP